MPQAISTLFRKSFGPDPLSKPMQHRQLTGKGTVMSLPRYATHGAGVFLFHYVRHRLPSHAVVLASVLAAVGCAIGSQYAIKNLVDALSAGTMSEVSLRIPVVILLALVAGDNLLWRLAGWVASYAFVAVGGDLRLDLFNHLSGHGSRYFADEFPGALAGRITTAANASWSIENSLTWTTIPPGVAVLSSIAVLGIINWHLAAVLAFIVTGLGLLIGWLAANGRHLHADFARQAAAVTGDLADIVSNMGIVRAFGAAQREHARLARRIDREMSAQRASLRSLERLRVLHAVSVFTVTAGVLIWAVFLWRAGLVTTGDVVLTTSLGFTVLHASRDLAMALVEVVQHFAKLSEAVKVLGLPHEIEDAPDAKPLINLGGAIAFQNVFFNYPDGGRVLENFNLQVPAGQKLGLVGKSGAGKSTILALLQRLYEPTSGEVVIDEQNIADVTLQSLRQNIAVVQQDISLFHRSVLENLRYGRPEATPEEVYAAADAAGCTEFIQRLPQGFDTIVGERGVKLSGGQRQRLAIARAFLRDAPIILLDEATSALDSESERLIQAALMRLIEGRTVIAIAHRLSTLSAFDRIVVLERGRIVEDGSSADHLRRKGVRSVASPTELSIGGGS
jgi:ATP-binding cassette, subfamily B, bacterial